MRRPQGQNRAAKAARKVSGDTVALVLSKAEGTRCCGDGWEMRCSAQGGVNPLFEAGKKIARVLGVRHEEPFAVWGGLQSQKSRGRKAVRHGQ